MKNLRLNKILSEMEKSNLSQILVTDPASIFYLTGRWIHPGERLLALYLNTNGNHKLFVNELFPQEAEGLGAEIVYFNDIDDSVKVLYNGIEQNKTLGIDKSWPSRFLLNLMELGFKEPLKNSSLILDKARMIKDEEERQLMRNASKLNDLGVDKLKDLVPSLVSEKKLGKMLGEIYEEIGADDYSFEPIIAYGKNAADPHHGSDGTMLKEGESVILDIGCLKDSYCSDMTRTVFYKSISEEQRKVYNIVLEANKRGIEAVKPGARFCDVDKAARLYIESQGYGKYFTHRTGHAIGIEVHDFGDVSSVNTGVLEEGMIFSVEPGIYLPGNFGVRIEDLVLVTKDGVENLNNFSKDLIVVE